MLLIGGSTDLLCFLYLLCQEMMEVSSLAYLLRPSDFRWKQAMSCHVMSIKFVAMSSRNVTKVSESFHIHDCLLSLDPFHGDIFEPPLIDQPKSKLLLESRRREPFNWVVGFWFPKLVVHWVIFFWAKKPTSWHDAPTSRWWFQRFFAPMLQT